MGNIDAFHGSVWFYCVAMRRFVWEDRKHPMRVSSHAGRRSWLLRKHPSIGNHWKMIRWRPIRGKAEMSRIEHIIWLFAIALI